jgi:hypothetical protein
MLKDRGLVLDQLQVLSSALTEELLQNLWRSAYAGDGDLFFFVEADLFLHALKYEQVILILEEKASIPR